MLILWRNSRSTTFESLILSPKVPSGKQIESLFSHSHNTLLRKPHVNALHQLYQGFTDWNSPHVLHLPQPSVQTAPVPRSQHIRPHGHQQGHTLVRDPQVALIVENKPISTSTMSAKVNLQTPDGQGSGSGHGCMKGCKESRGGQRGFSGWSSGETHAPFDQQVLSSRYKYSRVNKEYFNPSIICYNWTQDWTSHAWKTPIPIFPKQPLSLYCQLHSTEGLKSHWQVHTVDSSAPLTITTLVNLGATRQFIDIEYIWSKNLWVQHLPEPSWSTTWTECYVP